ncbi:hypothetical protein ACGYLI_10045 [Sulfitobacter sp. 1A13421]|uniref:hypothetical protein n=1 Tax=Sulfitobacter sp. 1A13421 TaxID=3368595 RepID=UPI00374574BB
MKHLHNIVLGLSLLLAPPATAEEGAVFAPLSLAEQGEQDFLAMREGLMTQLAEVSAPEDPARAGVLLGLAELHLAWMMRPEAAGFLEALDAETLSGHAARRHRTLSLALALLDGGAGSDLGQAVSWSVGWGQGQALRAAAFARLGAVAEAARLMPRTLESLADLSPAIQAAILPDLLEAALEAEDWEVAQALAAEFPDHAELRDGPAYRYLLARASEVSGDLLMAFDGYAQAAQGRDAYAQRARLALVRMGRETETLPGQDALSLLKTARWMWSGDALGREGAQLLAEVAAEQGDTDTALWALHNLLRTAPEVEADALRAQARAIYGAFYAAGAAGEIDLGPFLEGHTRISARWRFDPGFVGHAMAVPQRLLDTGMTALAAREYRALREMAQTLERGGATAPDANLMARLRRGEARALLAGGQADAAVDLLSGYADDQGAEAEALLVEALAQAGRSDELAALRLRAQDMDLRRSRAVALYETGKWGAARHAYLEMWEAHPKQFAFADATRLTLAAYQAGDSDTVARAATAFPALADLPGWAEIATGLGARPAEEGPLGSDVMRLSMESADRILDAVTKVTDVKESQ